MMSGEENKQEKEKDYRAMIRARAEQTKDLRQTLREKVELAKGKEKKE
jgi:hypothetical protein